MSVLDIEGRAVQYEYAPAGGDPVGPGPSVLVFHHGQPGAALLWDEMVAAAARHRWGVVTLSRPGYGSSGRRPGRSVADAAADVAAVLDHLGLGRFVTAGWSGGGPHALACGSLLAGRCAAVATIAGVAPVVGAEDLDFTAGMGPENVAEFEGLMAGDPDVESGIASLMGELVAIQADQLVEAFGGLVSQPDKDVLVDSFADYVAESMRRSAESGHYGYWDDGQAFVADWGFDWTALTVPVRVWRAGQDLMVPASHGEWLADHVAGAADVYLTEEGHVSLLRRHVVAIADGLATDAEGS